MINFKIGNQQAQTYVDIPINDKREINPLESNQKTANWRRFIKLILETKPSKLLVSIVLILSIGTTLVGLLVPLFTKNLINDFTVSSLSRESMVWLGGAIVIQALASGVSIYLLNHIGQSVIAGIRGRLLKKLLFLPIPYYDEHQTGETVSRMTNDTGVVKNLISDHLTNFITGIIAIVGSIFVMLILDWRMTMIMFISIPISFAILLPLGRKMHKISKGMQDETAKFTATLNQVLSEVRLVKSYNAEEIEYNNGNKGITRLFQFGLREAKVQAVIGPIMSLVIMVLLVVVLGYGGMRVSSGGLTAGDLVAFILYMFQIIMPMGQLTSFFTQFQKALGATERIITILDLEEEKDHSSLPVADVNQPIHLDNVTFSYNEKDLVIKDVSFSIDPGKVTAVVGPSGSGKTTLFALIERFYLPQSGKISLGNQSIHDFSLQSWRGQIGYVSQESSLLSGTIRDNLCYGINRKVDDKELEQVARMAYADQFIHELPEKYDTQVGERGVKLSGGQRQRIAIARALLRDPKILMLDEATSSLDSKSEIVVQKALENLMQGRTTLVIAHRLSTVVNADKIVFFEKGRITGSGTHQELLQSHNLYREFATQQLQIKETVPGEMGI